MRRVAVLGAGLVGRFVANKLAEDYKVDLYDRCALRPSPNQPENLALCYGIFPQNTGLIKDRKYDLVVNALSGCIGHKVLTALIGLDACKKIVDFSFMPEDPMHLDDLAQKKGITAVVDFGFAPGLCHMMVARDNIELEDHQSSTIWVGGLPADREVEYKAPFSPRDVVEEYTRPARYIKDGKVLTELPFEHNYYACHGGKDYSGFISDGLRTMLDTIKGPDLVEYTLRYDKHFQKMCLLKEDGFFNPEHIENTAKVLAKKWKMIPEDKDISLLRVTSTGKNKIIHHFLNDKYDEVNKVHSMARTTGLPAVAMAKEILENKYKRVGVLPPEYIAQDSNVYERIFKYLVENGIEITKEINHWEG